ncbi:MAG: Mannose-6-phosphate isomerase [Candidatus Uhrbacteria bacterium GW2011_GWF2_41_16]|uniref:Mannose-6-phosphate isomerase n=2 Tax=Candidatus Uhriibacteriota TaxID=1752732 RepID=A0A0G0VB41_9BACT|nr:MAG: Mannose-6-phosphate isomerase [Candidatus Uhrbacteria bacterium GW2011_GWC2_41_11]KKR98104.1 MAG: Mannose-6-phosphate isomerase [Candidatus Uhrbacteria bacterium GW2011_GWF2_41_16]HBP00330.1 cupin domain-containing protein [Candidatus Uhrbacteria bacterium]
MSYITNIVEVVAKNTNFRTVLYTATKSQLVVMNIPPGENVGEETHAHVEQILFFQSGNGKAILDGQESPVKAGNLIIVSPGTKHNFINTGIEPLIIATIYVPPNHIDGRIHKTKADAVADMADEEFGEAIV